MGLAIDDWVGEPGGGGLDIQLAKKKKISDILDIRFNQRQRGGIGKLSARFIISRQN